MRLLLSFAILATGLSSGGCGSSDSEGNDGLCDGIGAGDGVHETGATLWIDPSEVDQGVEGEGGTLRAAIDRIGTDTRGTIVLAHDGAASTTTYTLTTSLVVPNTIVLGFENGAIIDGTGTLTVHSPGHVDVGTRQHIFGSSVSIVYEETGTVWVDWYRENAAPGGTNMAPAIQAAVDDVSAIGTAGSLGQGGEVALSGEYAIYSTITITRPGVYIDGNGMNSTEIVNRTLNGHGLHFAPPDPVNDKVAFGGVRDLTISYAHGAGRENPSGAAAIYLDRYSQVHIQGVHLRDHFRGIEILGDGQVVIDNSVIMQGTNTTSVQPGSAAIRVGRREVHSGDPNGVYDNRDDKYYTEPNSIYVSNVNIRNIFSHFGFEDALVVDAVDGLYLSNVHVSAGTRSGVLIRPAQNDLTLGNIMSDGLFVDPIVGFSQHGILYAENPVLPSPHVFNHVWTNTIIDNADEYGVLMQGGWRNIVFDGGNIRNAGKHGFYAQTGDGVTISNISFAGHNATQGTFQNVNLLDVTGAVITGCWFNGAYRGVQIAGTSNGCMVSGCSFVGQTDPGVNRSIYLAAAGHHSNRAEACTSDASDTVVAASNLQFPVEHDTIFVTGADDIHGLDTDAHFNGYSGYNGKVVTLIFESTPVVYDAFDPSGVNICLSGSTNWTNVTAQDTLTLAHRDEVWYEVARSAN
ncbi:right-handed parallel beta-helix repeat-containing protein [Myxococcota bacterium]